jgi:hypothetical protein
VSYYSPKKPSNNNNSNSNIIFIVIITIHSPLKSAATFEEDG